MSSGSLQGLAARPRLLLCLDLVAPQAASDLDGQVQSPFVRACRRVLDHARAAGWQVAHVHASTTAASGARPIDGAAPLPSEPVMIRPGVSAFSSPEFRRWSRANPQAELLIIGASHDAACLSTALAAFDRGLAVTIVPEALSVSPQERLGLDGLEHIVQSLAAPKLRMTSVDALVGARKFALIQGGVVRAVRGG